MISRKLVNRLITQGELSMNGFCKNCIFGKHITYLFNKTGSQETELLERIYINIQGPLQV